MVVYCGQCGQPVEQAVGFCGNCGASVGAGSGPPPPAPPVAVPPGVAQAAAPGPAPRSDAHAAPSRRQTWRVATVGVLSMVLTAAAGWAAVGMVPTGGDEAYAGSAFRGVDDAPGHGLVVEGQDDLSGEVSEEPPADEPTSAPPEETTPVPPEDGSTSFLSSCGEVLDVVPTEAVAKETTVAVTLEFRPVCPEGEWISSSEFRVALSDVNGVPMADGTFDLSDKPLLIPGYGDASSYLVAEYDSGTAWVAPASLATAIADGLVVVECEPRDGAKGEPVDSDSETTSEDVTVTARTDESETEGTRRTALAALRRQVRADDPEVSDLEGAWVPQLSSKTNGTYDEYDGMTYDLADIYQQYLSLRLEYPNVRLLSSSEWGSYTLDGYWVVIAGVPFAKPNQALRWCRNRGIDESQCYAKQLNRDGDPDDTTRH